VDACRRWTHIAWMMLVLDGEARLLLDMCLVVSHVIAVVVVVVEVYWMVVTHFVFLSMVHTEMIMLVER
jgi:hypothetical protein